MPRPVEAITIASLVFATVSLAIILLFSGMSVDILNCMSMTMYVKETETMAVRVFLSILKRPRPVRGPLLSSSWTS